MKTFLWILKNMQIKNSGLLQHIHVKLENPLCALAVHVSSLLFKVPQKCCKIQNSLFLSFFLSLTKKKTQITKTRLCSQQKRFKFLSRAKTAQLQAEPFQVLNPSYSPSTQTKNKLQKLLTSSQINTTRKQQAINLGSVISRTFLCEDIM